MLTPYRLFSVLANVGYVTFGVAVCLVLIIASLYTIGVLAIVPGIVLLLLVLVGYPLAIFDGCKNPRHFSKSPSLRQWIFPGCFGFAGFCLIGLIVFGVGLYAHRFMNSGEFNGEWATYEEFSSNRRVRTFKCEKLFPPQSRDIRCRGATDAVLPFGFMSFRCKVSEEDFRAFAAKNGYELSENVFRNANTAIVDGNCHPAEVTLDQIGGWMIYDKEALPKRYLGYWYEYSNHGGIMLMYDLDAGILSGSYSTN